MNTFAPIDPGVSDIVGLIAAVGGGAVVLWLLAGRILAPFAPRQRAIIGWLLAALCGATLAFGWLAVGYPAFRAAFIADAGAYHSVIVELSEGLPSLEQPTRWGDRSVFLYGMAIAQALFGLNGYVSVVVNVLLVGITMLVNVDLARLLAGTRAATTTAAVTALLPAISFWSATPLREALVLGLTVVSVNGAVRVVQQPGLRSWILAVIPILLMLRTREIQVVPLTAALGTATLLRLWDRTPHTVRRVALHPMPVVLACVVAMATAVALGPQLNRVALAGAEQTQTTTSNLQRIADSPTTPTLDRASPTTPGELAARSPAAVVSYLWGPGPTATAPRLMIVEAATLWLLAPFVLLGGWLAVRSKCREAWILIAAATPAALIGAITLGNYGIISRMRLSTWLLLLPFAGWAIGHLYNRASWPRTKGEAES